MSVAHETDHEPHRPRANDHLVEPFFGGLGVDGGAPEASEPVGSVSGWRGILRRVFGLFNGA